MSQKGMIPYTQQGSALQLDSSSGTERQLVGQGRQRYVAAQMRAGLVRDLDQGVHAEYNFQRAALVDSAYNVSADLAEYPEDDVKPLLKAILLHQLQVTAGIYETVLKEYARKGLQEITKDFSVDERTALQRFLASPQPPRQY